MRVKNIDQHQVDKVFEQVADVIRRQQAFRSVARGTRHCRMVDTRVCCDPPETQEAYEVAMHSNWHQTGNSCDAAQAEEQRDETTKRALFSRDADATAPWRKEHGSAAWRAAKQATRDPDPCPQIVRLYAKASERMERK
jgi:hypothetical protein